MHVLLMRVVSDLLELLQDALLLGQQLLLVVRQLRCATGTHTQSVAQMVHMSSTDHAVGTATWDAMLAAATDLREGENGAAAV